MVGVCVALFAPPNVAQHVEVIDGILRSCVCRIGAGERTSTSDSSAAQWRVAEAFVSSDGGALTN